MAFGTMRVENGVVAASFSQLVCSEEPIPETIALLTGITETERKTEGKPLPEALHAFLEFVGTGKLVFHNAAFDAGFLQAACKKCGIPMAKNKIVDTLVMSRRKLRQVDNYKLSTVASYLEIDQEQRHRALEDSCLTAAVYEKLKELP